MTARVTFLYLQLNVPNKTGTSFILRVQRYFYSKQNEIIGALKRGSLKGPLS